MSVTPFRTHVTFETDLADGNEDQDFPGKDVAYCIQSELLKKGFEIKRRYECRYSHDFFCTVGSRRFHVILASVHGSMRQWIIQVESELGWFPKFLGLADSHQHSRLVNELDRILDESPNFINTRWYKNTDHFRRFEGSDWTAAP